MWDDIIDLNASAAFRLTQGLAARLRPGGAICNVSSIAATMPWVVSPALGAAEAALEHWSTSLAVQLGPASIRVNLVRPGFVGSDQWAAVDRAEFDAVVRDRSRCGSRTGTTNSQPLPWRPRWPSCAHPRLRTSRGRPSTSTAVPRWSDTPMSGDEITVLDVGGTYLRWAQWSPASGLGPVQRISTPSVRTRPDDDVTALRAELVEVMAAPVPARARAAVSFGAALDHRSGLVYASAPLWGDRDAPFDLAARLAPSGRT